MLSDVIMKSSIRQDEESSTRVDFTEAGPSSSLRLSSNQEQAVERSLENAFVISPFLQSRKRNLYRGLTLASVLLNPLFAIFLYVAITSALDESRKKLGFENAFWEIFFIIWNVTITSMSGISDVIVVNPIEETETLLKSLGNNRLTVRLNHLAKNQRRSIKYFNYFNQGIGNSVFLVGAASAALSLSYLSSSKILLWGAGIPITILSHIYLNMLSREKIDEHSYQFLQRLFKKNEWLIMHSIRSPGRSSEVLIQVLVNALNRGITYGYIMQQILKEFFNEDKTTFIIPFVSYAAASSFYTFLISRTLNVHKQFFNPQFKDIPLEILNNTKVSCLGVFVDISMTLLRASAASVLLFRHGSKNTALNISLATFTGLFLSTQGLYVRYNNRRYRIALDTHLKQQVMNVQLDFRKLRQLSSEKLFDLIQERFKVHRGIKITATLINGGSRFADWFSFLGFLITMNELIGSKGSIQFDFYDLLCIQQLLCNPALENALSFFQEGMIDVLSYYRTKLHLEWNERHFGWRSLLKAKEEYPKAYLVKFLPMPERELQDYVRSNDGNIIEQENGVSTAANKEPSSKQTTTVSSSPIIPGFLNFKRGSKKHNSPLPTPHQSSMPGI